MKITQLIEALEKIKSEVGDCGVAIEVEELNRYLPLIAIMGKDLTKDADKPGCIIFTGIHTERAVYTVRTRSSKKSVEMGT